MTVRETEDGLRVVDLDQAEDESESSGDDRRAWSQQEDPDLESLRDEFVDAFNARDLEALLGLVHADVECPDIADDGAEAFAEELESIWERSPAAILTRAFLEGAPCAVAWLPDEDGCWSRASLVCFDCDRGLLSLVALPDDPDALDRVDAEDPGGEELEEGSDWGEWDSGEATQVKARDRDRP